MKRHHFLFVIVAALLLSSCAKMYLRKGDSAYQELEYSKAVENYEKALAKKDFPEAKPYLAESYRLMNQTQEAERVFAEVVKQPNVDPKWKLHYGLVLQENGKCDQAIEWFEEYLKVNPENQIAQAQVDACKDSKFFENDENIYTIDTLEVNVDASSFSPTFYDNGIVFSSDRPDENDSDIYGWTGQRYLNLYYSEKDSMGRFTEAKPLEGVVKGKYHDGPASFDSSGTTMFFTRTNIGGKRNKMTKDEDAFNNLELMKASYDGSAWSNLEEFPYNDDAYSTGQPALSKDGNTLYYVSDMPGGLGGTDLYVSYKNDTGWTQPKNLGPDVNTTGNDMFPFLYESDSVTALFYSSNGRKSFGGLDIYSVQLVDGQWINEKHYPSPVNSSKDDFGMIINEDGDLGYFTSNRSNIKGFDKIYKVKIEERPIPIVGIVRDIDTSKVKVRVANALVYIKKKNGATIDSVRSDENGVFVYEAYRGNDYEFSAKRRGYMMHRIGMASTVDVVKSDTLNSTDVLMRSIRTGMIVSLDNIYYDYDKWNIRDDAKPTLDTIVNFLKFNDDVKIELSSHTDSRASDKYNNKLSQKRAESAVKYIIKNGGIPQDRVTAKGYGEEKLVNECKDGVECTEEKHQQNRRTEFTIIETENDKILIDTRYQPEK